MVAKRDITYDLMKGLAILAMLCGHCIIPNVLHSFIYIWHMPLFFVVSGYFYHQKSRTQCLKSSFFGLLVPYFITCGVALGVSLVLSMDNSQKIFFGTLGVSSEWFGSNAMVGYGGNGPLWFLMALFWCRIIYDALRRIITNIWLFGGAILFLSVLSVVVGNKYYVPFYIAHGMTALVFYYVGNLVHLMNVDKRKCKSRFLILMLCVMALGMKVGEPYFYALYFPNWIVNVLAALSACAVIYYLCSQIKNNKFAHMLAYIGRLSLLLLSVHSLDYMFSFSKAIVYTRLSLEGKGASLLFDSMLFIIPLLGIVFLPKMSLIRKIFKIA